MLVLCAIITAVVIVRDKGVAVIIAIVTFIYHCIMLDYVVCSHHCCGMVAAIPWKKEKFLLLSTIMFTINAIALATIWLLITTPSIS